MFATHKNIEYMGFEYVASPGISLSRTDYRFMFYTGQDHEGKKLYVNPSSIKSYREGGLQDVEPDKTGDEKENRSGAEVRRIPKGRYIGVPQCIFPGKMAPATAHTLAAVPPVYAYSLYGSYNRNEQILLGFERVSGRKKIDTRITSPWKAYREAGDGWEVAYVPQYVYVPEDWLYNYDSVQWRWDPAADGSPLPYGRYKVLVLDKYPAYFSIDPGTPSVNLSGRDHTTGDKNAESHVDKLLAAPQHEAFSQTYGRQGWSADLRNDLTSEMLFKAAARGLDYDRLSSAINEANVARESLPCMALHARFNGKPAWFVVFNVRDDTGLSGGYLLAMDDETGSIVYEQSG